jgi:CRISPR-associated protein Cas1
MLDTATTLNELVGFEGNAARGYFAALQLLTPPEFGFTGRTRRPPTDPISAMLSLAYGILYRNVVTAIERHGLNPYVGFLHVDRQGHMALASDLMEGWRPFVVDDTVLTLVNTAAVSPAQFDLDGEGAMTMDKESMRTLIEALLAKLTAVEPYFTDDEKRYSVQSALDLQVQSLIDALDAQNAELFKPTGSSVAAEVPVSASDQG